MAEAKEEILAFWTFPREQWRQIWSTNRLTVDQELTACRVVSIFPNEGSVVGLAGSVLPDIHDEWQAAERRYFSESSMAKLIARALQWRWAACRATYGELTSLRILSIPTSGSVADRAKQGGTMAEPERPGTWPRHAYRNWRGVHSVKPGRCVAIISIAAMVTTASAASAPAPPSWLTWWPKRGR